MDRIASSSKDWFLSIALAAGLLGSVAIAKHLPMTTALGLGASVVSVALAALLVRYMRSGIATRAVLLFMFTLSFVLSVLSLGAFGSQ